MNPLLDNVARQPRIWSARLGALAAEQAASRPGPSARLAAVLDYLRRREQAQHDTQAKLRAQHFIMEP